MTNLRMTLFTPVILCCMAWQVQAQTTAPAASRPHLDPRGVIIEVVRPRWVEKFADGDALWQRTIEKHAALLQDPRLVHEVIVTRRNGIKPPGGVHQFQQQIIDALRVRVLPKTPLIELSLQAPVGGYQPPILADALAEQYVENENQAAERRLQSRLAEVEHEIKRYEFRRDALTDDRCKRHASTQRADEREQRLPMERLKIELQETSEQLKSLHERREAIRAEENDGAAEVRIIRSPSHG